MTMNDTKVITIDFDGARLDTPVHRITDGVYRLACTPWILHLGGIELSIGDVIEVEQTPTVDGNRRFKRVVQRSSDTHEVWIVGPAFLRSSYFSTFAAALEAGGGTWEAPIDGLLFTHLPLGRPFDVAAELDHQREQAWIAGVRDEHTDSEVAPSPRGGAPGDSGDDA